MQYWRVFVYSFLKVKSLFIYSKPIIVDASYEKIEMSVRKLEITGDLKKKKFPFR